MVQYFDKVTNKEIQSMEIIEMKQGIVINSVEVADMVGKPHNDLMKDIRRYIVVWRGKSFPLRLLYRI